MSRLQLTRHRCPCSPVVLFPTTSSVARLGLKALFLPPQVFQVRKRDTGRIYAMKVMRKVSQIIQSACSRACKACMQPALSVALWHQPLQHATQCAVTRQAQGAAIVNVDGTPGTDSVISNGVLNLRVCCGH